MKFLVEALEVFFHLELSFLFCTGFCPKKELISEGGQLFFALLLSNLDRRSEIINQSIVYLYLFRPRYSQTKKN